MKRDKSERQIFQDASGRRWRALKLISSFLILCLIVGGWWMGQRILSFSVSTGVASATSEHLLSAAEVDVPSLDLLTEELSMLNTPVVGSGPFVRLVEVDRQSIRGAFTGANRRALTSDEILSVGSHRYVFERYGDTVEGKRLVLTFDDGPDPINTPRLLDVLSKYSIPATFFIVGEEAIRNPAIVERMVKEGHGIGNHSFTHSNFSGLPELVATQEINLTRRALRSISARDTTLFRPPYAGPDNQSLRDASRSILTAQKLGYTIAMYDFDTQDWQHPGDPSKIPFPPFDGKDHVLLLHDGGGERVSTITYVERLVAEAKKHGYAFAPMHKMYPRQPRFLESKSPSLEDRTFMVVAQAILVWPLEAMFVLFTITVLLVFAGTALYVLLAVVQNRRTRNDAELSDSSYRPSVAIIVPAYNEEKVLSSCVLTLRKSIYPITRICIVDDGSTDKTWQVATRLARRYKEVIALHKDNGGKASALNMGIKRVRSEVIIGIDADTHFLPDTIKRLVRHFADPKVGAVAGLVKVGNRSGLLARCQALEYSTSISLERTAQAFLGAIMVVPGACGAWRRRAVARAGWYSSATLAEDCDLTVGVCIAGYRVLQDNTAVALTEVPRSLSAFARQRFRWTFGNLQVYWKYRNILLSSQYGWLDSFVLPMAIISAVGPLIFLPLLAAIAVTNLISGQYMLLLVFMGISFMFQFLRSWIGLKLGRETARYLLLLPVVRLLYGPMRIYLIYSTLLKALRGVPVSWNKLTRFGMNVRTASYTQ